MSQVADASRRDLERERRILSEALRDVDRARSIVERALREVDRLRATPLEESRWTPPSGEWDYPIW